MSRQVFGLSLVSILGFVSVVTAVWFTLPQLVKLRRGGGTAGLSLESLANSTISLAGWTVYGIGHANVWVTVASAAGIPATIATVVMAARAGQRLRPQLPLVWAALLLVTALVDRVFGSALIDVVLGCSILWYVAPAAVTAWRSDDVSGLAAQTWFVLAADGLVFGLYGLVADVAADRVYSVASIVGAGLVLTRIASARHSAEDSTGSVPSRRVSGAEESPDWVADTEVVDESRLPRRVTGVEGDSDVVTSGTVWVVDVDRDN